MSLFYLRFKGYVTPPHHSKSPNKTAFTCLRQRCPRELRMKPLCFCPTQHGSHQPQGATEHLKCGQCETGTRLLIDLNTNRPTCPGAPALAAAGLRRRAEDKGCNPVGQCEVESEPERHWVREKTTQLHGRLPPMLSTQRVLFPKTGSLISALPTCVITGRYLDLVPLASTEPRKWEWKRKSLSRVQLFATPGTIQSKEFCRPEYWSG